MFGRFMPTEGKFFEIFNAHATCIVSATLDLLRKTFITPLDRDEIHKLITTMDDILDLMEDVATAISLYDVQAVTSEASQLAHICTATSERVQFAVSLLSDMKQASQILKACEDIDRLESEAD